MPANTPCGNKDCCCPKSLYNVYNMAQRTKNRKARKIMTKAVKRIALARKKNLKKRK